jgi:hypothetical protein
MECALIRCYKMVCIFVMTVVLVHASILLNMRAGENGVESTSIYDTCLMAQRSEIIRSSDMHHVPGNFQTSSRSARACSV